MKGSKKVIDTLNGLLAGELTSMDIYLLESKILDDRGLTKLAAQMAHEVDDEKLHVDLLTERIVLLGGMPNVASRDSFKLPEGEREILEYNLQLEIQVMNNVRAALKICEQEHDYVSRDMLLKLLKDTEEDHIDWHETQLDLIDKIGLQNYLQSMM